MSVDKPLRLQGQDIWIRDGPTLYLNTAAEGLLPIPSARAYAEVLERRTIGRDISGVFSLIDTARKKLSEFIGARTSESTVMTGNTTEGINIVANNFFDWKSGDNLVMGALDFPSSYVIGSKLRETRGIEVRIAREESGTVPISSWEEVIDDSTRLVILSYVSHVNGYVHPLKEIVSLAHEHGAKVCVDAIQALGWQPLDVCDCHADFVTSACFKWLLGPHGIAFLYFNPDNFNENILPDRVGWRSLEGHSKSPLSDDPQLGIRDVLAFHKGQRFETGNINTDGLPVLLKSLEILEELTPRKIRNHCLKLSHYAYENLENTFEMITPPDTESPFFSFKIQNVRENSEVVMDEQIYVTWTARTGSGLVRVSPYIYNTYSDIDRFVQILKILPP